MSNKPFCVLPWVHVTTTTTGGNLPCCIFRDWQQPGSVTEFFESDWMAELRRRMLAHDPPAGCSDCVRRLQNNTYSERDSGWDAYKGMLHQQEWVDEPMLRYVELNFSNICNLKCRQCGSDRSSKWIQDSEAMGFHTWRKLVNDIHISDDVLRNIRYIRLLGGEPLLHIDQLRNILERMDRLNVIDQLSLGITTNGTIRLDDDMVSLLDRCRHVGWTCSIDAYGELNDYRRSGSNWHQIADNVAWLDDIIRGNPRWGAGIGSTCMIFIANAMTEIADWIDSDFPAWSMNHYWYPVISPEYLSVDRLPTDYLHELSDKYQKRADTVPDDERGLMRKTRWWIPLSDAMRTAAEQGPAPVAASRIPYGRPTPELVFKLDEIRGDQIGKANPEIYHQIKRMA